MADITVYVRPANWGAGSQATVYHFDLNCRYIRDSRVLEKSLESQRRSSKPPCNVCSPDELSDPQQTYECPACGRTKRFPEERDYTPCPTIDCLMVDREMEPVAH